MSEIFFGTRIVGLHLRAQMGIGEMSRMIICGGRDRHLTDGDRVMLDIWHRVLGITEIVSGGARGVDADGKAWAIARGLPVKEFLAFWDIHGKKAGPLRNEQMAEYASGGYCAVFPGGRGTSDMERRARKHGLMVLRAD